MKLVLKRCLISLRINRITFSFSASFCGYVSYFWQMCWIWHWHRRVCSNLLLWLTAWRILVTAAACSVRLRNCIASHSRRSRSFLQPHSASCRIVSTMLLVNPHDYWRSPSLLPLHLLCNKGFLLQYLCSSKLSAPGILKSWIIRIECPVRSTASSPLMLLSTVACQLVWPLYVTSNSNLRTRNVFAYMLIFIETI